MLCGYDLIFFKFYHKHNSEHISLDTTKSFFFDTQYSQIYRMTFLMIFKNVPYYYVIRIFHQLRVIKHRIF